MRALVVLAGSKAGRNWRLRSLAAIVQVVRSKDFDPRWATARDEQSLRDIFLLSERRWEPSLSLLLEPQGGTVIV